ncbi:MAG: hypothetical protein ACP5J4_15345 [Anaerolineae bacterium]
MTEERKTQEEPRQPMGVLGCLAAGFEIVARRPTLLIIPLLLDLFLWLGPRLSLAPIFMALERFYKALPPTEGMLAELNEQTMLVLPQLFSIAATRYNLFALLSPAPLFGAPTVMATQLTLERPMGVRPEIVVASPFAVLGLIVLFAVVGLGISALYLRTVGRQVITETEMELPGPPSFLKLWGHLIILALIVLFVLGTLSFAGSIFTFLIGLISSGLFFFATTMLFALLMFVAFHMIFAIPGMVQLRRSPLHAIQESILLVRVDFVRISWLVLLILVISRGFNVVWTLPDPATWSNLIGIAGHAFVSTALIATLFVYYQERWVLLPTEQKVRAPQEIPAHSLMGD